MVTFSRIICPHLNSVIISAGPNHRNFYFERSNFPPILNPSHMELRIEAYLSLTIADNGQCKFHDHCVGNDNRSMYMI